MVKVFKILVGAIITGVILSALWLFSSPKTDLGRGYSFYDLGIHYWQSIYHGDHEVIPIRIVDYAWDERYILLQRDVVKLYGCPDHEATVFTGTMEYWIVDKNTDIAYVSSNKEKIHDKLKILHSNLTLPTKRANYKRYKFQSDIRNCHIENNIEDDAFAKIIRL
jgi:hypothetical protein